MSSEDFKHTDHKYYIWGGVIAMTLFALFVKFFLDHPVDESESQIAPDPQLLYIVQVMTIFVSFVTIPLAFWLIHHHPQKSFLGVILHYMAGLWPPVAVYLTHSDSLFLLVPIAILSLIAYGQTWRKQMEETSQNQKEA